MPIANEGTFFTPCGAGDTDTGLTLYQPNLQELMLQAQARQIELLESINRHLDVQSIGVLCIAGILILPYLDAIIVKTEEYYNRLLGHH